MHEFTLDDGDTAAVRALLDTLTKRHSTVEDLNFQHELAVYAHELPLRLRRFLNTFRLREPAGVALISGYPVDEEKIGPTPGHWNPRKDRSPALRDEMFLLLCAALLGDPFAWSTQQDGYLVHDVIPVRAHADQQLGTGCHQTLVWHTEDAFHPYRADYIGLLCLRNPDAVATTFACVEDLPLDPASEHVQVLFEPRFYLEPDGSHLPRDQDRATGWFEGGKELAEQAYARIRHMLDDPEPVPILSGAPGSPYLRVDPYFRDLHRLDAAARAAYDWLLAEIESHLHSLVFRPGDCFFIDNYRSVHGRDAFHARHDGTDRWLKRVNITRDLRRSRDSRVRAHARMIF